MSAMMQRAGTRRGRCGCMAGGAERREAVKVECSSSTGTPSCTPSSGIFRHYLTLRKSSRLHRAARERVSVNALHQPTEISDSLHTEEIVAVAANNDPFLRAMSKTVDKYMEQCGRCWVNFGALFSNMNL